MQATLRSDVYELDINAPEERSDLLVEAEELARQAAADRVREGAKVKDTKIAANEKVVKVTVVYRPAA